MRQNSNNQYIFSNQNRSSINSSRPSSGVHHQNPFQRQFPPRSEFQNTFRPQPTSQPNRVQDHFLQQNVPNTTEIGQNREAKSKEFYEGFQSNQNHFNFVDQLISEVSDGTNPLTPKKNLTYCHFSGIQEQSNSGKATINQICSSNRNQNQDCLDQRCIWDKTHVRVITNGGQEFVVPMQLDVIDVYAIKDGIILKTLHNEDQACGFDINQKLKGNDQNLKSPSDQSMQETPTAKVNGNQNNQAQFSYFTVNEHPLNEVHPLGVAQVIERIDEIYQSSQSFPSVVLALNTSFQILYHSSTIPLVVSHCSQTKKLSFGVLKQVAKKEGGRQPRDRQSSGNDLEMADNNQFISQFDQIGNDFGGNNQTQSNLQTDSLLDNPYAHSLLPHSRHPVLDLCPLAPSLLIQQLWHITSTTCPDQILLSTNQLNDSIGTELILYIFYKDEAQLAFIKFDMLEGKFKAQHVEKEVKSIVSLALFPRSNVEVKDEWSQEVKSFVSKVAQIDGEIGVVSNLKQDSMVVYKGMDVIAVVPVEEMSVGSSQIQKGSLIESFYDPRDSFFTVQTSTLNSLHRQVQSSNRVKLFATDDHIVLEIIKILRKMLPSSLFIAIFRDIVELLLISGDETKNLSDFEKVAGLFLSLVSKQGHFCGLQPPIAQELQKQVQMTRQRPELNQQDHFSEMINTEFSEMDDLFDDEIESLKQTNPIQVKGIQNVQIQRPKSSSGKFSRSQNMLNPQNFVFEMGKAGDKPQFLTLLKTDPKQFSKHQDDIFKLFHYLYEDTKLNVISFATHGILLAKFLTRWILEIGSQSQNTLQASNEITAEEFLNLDNQEGGQSLVRALKKIGFVNHYLADFPQLKSLFKTQFSSIFGDISQATNWLTFKPDGQFVKVDWVPDILQTLQCTLQAKQSSQPFVVLYGRTRKISKAFNIAFSKDQEHNFKDLPQGAPVGQLEPYLQNLHCAVLEQGTHKTEPYSNVYEQLLFWLHGEGLDKNQIYYQLPSQVSLPLREALRFCKLNLAQISTRVWPEALYRLVGREDVIKNIKTLEQKEQAFDVDRLFGLSAQAGQVAEQPRATQVQKQSSDQGGFVEYLISRFSKDSRYKEVVNLLCSAKDMTLKNRYFKPEFDQLEAEAQKELRKKVLDKLFIGQLSKMVGRGILSFGTLEMLSTEMLQTPRISLVGQIPATNSSIQIEKREEEIKELMQWPQFHNGAAEAMRIAMNLSLGKDKEASFARNWIMQHKPATPRPEHAGFLLALGLLGMLGCLQNTDIYQHLKSLHDSTTIGILLGKAASKIGSMDLQYTKTLCMHITYLQPPNLHADISLPVQSAAVIGAGLLYKGTRYRQITEMLLAQIGRKPINDRSIEREVYALSSGMALGMVNLGAGQELQTQLGDLNIEERLLRFIEGGKIMELPRSMLQANQNIENQQCSSIREGNQVNVHITAAGGLFALCLIYIQSNNELIASKLQMPETFHQLEYVRPAFLLQKVLARNMILWDSIEATQEWIDSQVPPIVRSIYENDIAATEKKYAQQIGGECFDFATIALCNVNITAGAILSLGYKYAGTGNEAAAALIDRFIHKLRKAKIANQMSQNHLLQIYTDLNKNWIDKYTQENCLCMAALAMSIVMAGTGNQDCFKTIRILRKRLETNENNYGHQMAISMALGFLFLGSGAYTLGRSKFQIAALMCALYPIFPKEPNENRYHLQATRHFWVLAVESRLVQTRDVDTNEFVQTEIILKNKDGSISRAMTPALVDESIVELELENERYFPVKIQLQKGRILQENQSSLEQIIFIKKKKLQEAVELQSSQEPKVNDTTKQDGELISHNNDPEVLDLIEDIERLLEDFVPKSFLTKKLRIQFASCLSRLKGCKKKTFENVFLKEFAHISGNESEVSLILENVFGFNNDSQILDLQDSCYYLGDIFSKYLQPESLKEKINQMVAVNELVYKQERSEFLKESLVKENEFLETMTSDETIDEEELGKQISSLGLVGQSQQGLDAFTIQTCHILIEMFLGHLSQKDQSSIVQSYRTSIAQDQLDDNQTTKEITQNLVKLIKSILDKSHPNKFDEGVIKKVMLKHFFKIGQF